MAETGITIVVAMDGNRAIGKNEKVPWHLKNDMDHFVDFTDKKSVVMGRKTYLSIPKKYRPLPNRNNLVLTRDRDFVAPGALTLGITEIIFELSKLEEVCVIGGGEIYNHFFPFADRLVVTRVGAIISGADTFFPEIGSDWTEKKLFHHYADPKNDYSFAVFEYTRRGWTTERTQ